MRSHPEAQSRKNTTSVPDSFSRVDGVCDERPKIYESLGALVFWADFEAYLDGFLPNVQEILENFDFATRCAQKKFCDNDTSRTGEVLDAVRDEGKDKSLNWQDITPTGLQPAVTAIRKAFDDASWSCGESARRLCFAGLHPTPGNQQPTIPATDLGPYKKYLVAAIGDRAREVIGRSNQTPPVIFRAYLDLYRIGVIAVIKSLFEEALQIGIAQRLILKLRPIQWATSHLRILIDEEKSSVQLWIKRVCDLQDYSNLPQGDEELDEVMFWKTWRAPRLIHMAPAGNARYDAGTAWKREDDSTSQRLLESHGKMFVLSCHSDLDKIAGLAQVQLAKRPIKAVTPSPEKSSEANAGHVTGPNHKPTPAASPIVPN